jgi:hypothetical protein
MTRRLPLLIAVVVVGAPLAFVSLQDARREQAAAAICEAATSGQPVNELERLSGDDAPAASALECMCVAAGRQKQPEACVALVREALAAPIDSLLEPVSVLVAADVLFNDGQRQRADALLRDALERWPDDKRIFNALVSSVFVETHHKDPLLALWRRLPAELDVRHLNVAYSLYLLGATTECQEVVRNRPRDPKGAVSWATVRAACVAADGPTALLAFTDSLRGQIPEPERLALTMNAAARQQLKIDQKLLLEDAIGALADLTDPLLVQVTCWFGYNARIKSDRAAADEIDRICQEKGAWTRPPAPPPTAASQADVPALLRFSGLEPGERLRHDQGLISPEHFRSTTSPEVRAVAGELVRWVVVRADGTPCESGTVVAVPPETPVAIERLAECPSGQAALGPLRGYAADGHRRVFVVIADSGEWRIIRYLQARGELPVLARLEREGGSRLLESDPPMTSEALRRLVFPQAPTELTFVERINQLGDQIGYLPAVQRHPVASLALAVRRQASIFEVLAERDHSSVALLGTIAGAGAPAHSTRVGPSGVAIVNLDVSGASEPPSTVQGPTRAWFTDVTVKFEELAQVSAQGTDSLVVSRIIATDHAAHEVFDRHTRTIQDNGQTDFLELYRAIDRELYALLQTLDDDDDLVFMSDHGTLSSSTHSPDAVFIVHGAGVPDPSHEFWDPVPLSDVGAWLQGHVQEPQRALP